ncbi:PREDICTED: uncharacterized protein LOC109486943 [Branchiostoma belcheri]|uniref:Uncharacterized protein LOC109486943 n=1 Tax=Branchiostoma belcheri TaxID=7741 RepID=A0A6P5ATM9_BRABE|nr:PREDICTED: uncharacterized protein LOC109486943 [Branchiostoma belcheri]
MVDGDLHWVTVGGCGVWGIRGEHDIYFRVGTFMNEGSPGTEWQKVDGDMGWVFSGNGIVWSIDHDYKVYVRTGIDGSHQWGTSWKEITGKTMKSLCVSSSSNQVWAVDSEGAIQRRTGIGAGSLEGTGWEAVGGGDAVEGGFSYVSNGYSGVWAISATGSVWYREGTYGSLGAAVGSAWVEVTGVYLVQITVGYDVIWGVNSQGQIFVRIGLSIENPRGAQWGMIEGSLSQVYVSSTSNRLWGCNSNDNIWRREGISAVGVTAAKFRWLISSPEWAIDSAGTPWVHGGVTYDAAKTLDMNLQTFWNPQGLAKDFNQWHIIFNFGMAYTISRFSINNYGDTSHDIKAFKLQTSATAGPGYNWVDVLVVTDAAAGTHETQRFRGFAATSQYWRLYITATHTGWQPWLKEVGFYGMIAGRCPASWSSAGALCYRAYDETANWHEAELKCRQGGGRLASIKHPAFHYFVVAMKNAMDANGDFWIGLNDEVSEGVWSWTDQSGVSQYSAWAQGEPNNVQNEDCGHYNKHGIAGTHQDLWNDNKCDQRFKFICERDVLRPGEVATEGVHETAGGVEEVVINEEVEGPPGGVITEVHETHETIVIPGKTPVSVQSPTCSAKANVILLVDGSKSVRTTNFPNVIKFLLKLAAGFEIGPNGAKIGVYQFGTNVRTEFSIGQYNTREEILNAITRIQYMNEWGTFTGKALDEVYKKFPAGDTAQKVVVIITDGKAMDDEVLAKASQDIKADGGLVSAVGVARFKLKDLRIMASSDSLVFTATDFDQMDAIRDAVLEAVCKDQSRRDIAWEIDSYLQFLKESAVELVDNLEAVKERRLVGRDFEEDEYVAAHLSQALDALFELEGRLEKRGEYEGSWAMDDLRKIGDQLAHIRDIAVPLELKEVPEYEAEETFN